MLLIFVLLIITSAFTKMGNDEGIWSYIGRAWNRNDILPYTGTIENKTPAIFILYKISDALFGVNLVFVRILGILSILIGSVMLYKIGRLLFNEITGFFSLLIYGLMNCWILFDGHYAGQTESFMTTFIIVAFYYVIKFSSRKSNRHLLFLSGLSIGLAIQFKQVALFSLLALIAFHILVSKCNWKKKILHVSYILVGVVFIFVLISLTLMAQGISFTSFIEGAWLILTQPGSSAFLQDTFYSNWSNTWMKSRFVTIYPFLIIAVLRKNQYQNRFIIPIVIWLLLDFIASNLSGYFYGHQLKQIIPSLAILLAIVISNELTSFLKKQFKSNAKRILLLGMIIISILFFPYVSFSLGIKRIILGQEKSSFEKVAEWLKVNTKEDEYIYMLGGDCNPILSMSERISSSKYFNSIFVSNQKSKMEVLKDLKNNSPKYILKDESTRNISQTYGEEFETYFNKHFSPVSRQSTIEIFKRKN